MMAAGDWAGSVEAKTLSLLKTNAWLAQRAAGPCPLLHPNLQGFIHVHHAPHRHRDVRAEATHQASAHRLAVLEAGSPLVPWLEQEAVFDR